MTDSVSVIIPVFNGEAHLEKAIESALSQTTVPDEIIVVDDGSTDASAEIAHSFPVTYIYQENRGAAAARNAGITHSHGDHIALLDANDYWLPTKLEQQIEALRTCPDAGIALCYLRFIFLTEDGQPPAWFHDNGTPDGEPGYSPSCWLIRRSTWNRVGPFEEHRRHAEDIDWLARAYDLGIETTMPPEPLVVIGVQERGLTADLDGTKQGILAALRSSVARKKLQDAR